MASFTRTWNTAYEQSPADTDNASEGAQRIRNSRIDLRERLEIDHSLAGDTDDGEHKKVTLIEQASDPSTVANRGFLYTKDDGGATELYYKDAGGTVIKITQAGLINPSLILPSVEPDTLDNIEIAASVAANILTIDIQTLNSVVPSASDIVRVSFRDSSLVVGKYTTINIIAALTIAIPQGATLGYENAETHDIQVFLIDNSGAVELAVGYMTDPSASMPDETGLVSTTILNSSSDAINTLYSTAARTNVPIRHIGKVTIATGATAGDWDTAPTKEVVLPTSYIHPVQLPDLPAEAGASAVLIESRTMTGNAVEQFTIDSTYDYVYWILKGVRPSVDLKILWARLMVGGTPQAGATDYAWAISSYLFATGALSPVYIGDASDSQMDLIEGVVGNVVGENISGKLELFSPSATNIQKVLQGQFRTVEQVGAGIVQSGNIFFGSYMKNITDVIDGLEFRFDTGNIAAGSISMYALKQ